MQMNQFHVLQAGTLDAGATFKRPRQALPEQVTLDSPAIDVMTDLAQVTAETVSANLAVDDAEQKMIASGIRLLFVTNPLNEVIGIVTSRDLSGERILRLINDSRSPRKDLIVRDIMTPTVFAVVALALVGTALAAAFLPARRAARLDPMAVLRCE